ncbi:lactonase family protein [Roseomonas marmotae]|uniref:Beta-propeller fold lactonase family protein n=1 Tax=Roseomonas marmotae TaxID=2768161 RepID=A0ABS3KCJ8_9PROT|nr:beta-propeller fold lactonase family protein [Roseomonas marmotae]MBO1075184.1 beta-propeller fold lactonase family protein [Roseomonas marmotae]QTI79707.1 beta-propeller fold lactonase family protein [Roseomonas marmotae]
MSPEEAGHGILHLAIGSRLFACRLEPGGGLRWDAGVEVPEAVQYAWPHPRLPLLYAAFSNRASGRDDRHGVAAFRIDRQTGALSPFGEPVFVESRPIHLTLDPAGRYLLMAYNQPSALTVHRLGEDGGIGAPVRQERPVEAGIYAHQLRVSPSGGLVLLCARGNDATAGTAEEPGSIQIFRFRDGQLSQLPPAPVFGTRSFGPRHLDFHPSQPWVYVSLERGNQLLAYELEEESGRLSPLFSRDTLFQGAEGRAPRQYAGAIHLHPNGRFLYLVNRSDGAVEEEGQKLHGGGENSVACFAIAPATGEPELIQTAETRSFHCRSFSIHPEGRMLVTAAVGSLAVREGDALRHVPPSLTFFGLGEDGRLTLQGQHALDSRAGQAFWCGMLAP